MKLRWPFVSRSMFEAVAQSAVITSQQARDSASCLMEACEKIQDLEIENQNVKAALSECRQKLKRLKGSA